MSGEVVAMDFPNETVRGIVRKLIESEEINDYKMRISAGSNKGDNYLSVLYRVHIDGTKNGEAANLNIVLKTALCYGRDKFPIERIFKLETCFYTEIWPEFDQLQINYNVPEDMRLKCIKCYDANLTDMCEVIVMEDLGAQGFVMGNRRLSLSFDQLRLILMNLSRLHAISFAMKQKDMPKFKEIIKKIGDEVFPESFEQAMILCSERALAALEDEECVAKFKAFSVDAWKKFMAYVKPEGKEPYTVLCHGDSWINNVLFRYEGEKPVEVRLLDWQMIKHSSPVLDIAYLIFSSTDEETRAKHLLSLLELYYENLKAALKRLDCDIDECYPREIYDKHIKEMMPFGLIMAFLTAPIFMSEDDDIVDLEEILKKDEFSMEYLELKNSVSQKRYSDRINGVVRDFVKMGLI